ncbi:aldose 1-epimerase family protein [Aquisphaera insulae]|uniref:aldose 1-epimerase family protein n=1 Tax=Aquisphaera insulae TaxID=2712864 RepID=UPI0013EB8D48|nr:aldose 1-epimerase family protein [Aquisphaera insulae]
MRRSRSDALILPVRLLAFAALVVGRPCAPTLAQQAPPAAPTPAPAPAPARGPIMALEPGHSKAPLRQKIISVQTIMNADPWVTGKYVFLSRHEIPECPTAYSVRKFRYFGGKQEILDVIWIESGKLQIAVLPTRGMGIKTVLLDGVPVFNWDSPVKETVHPSLINLHDRGGTGWLDGFSEWFCRCGLEWNGLPGTDRFQEINGRERTMDLTLHGRIAYLPSQEVVLIAEREPPYRVTIRGEVHERSFDGPNLLLASEVSIVPGERSFRIGDTVTNLGGSRQEFQMLYRSCFGPPILDEGAKILAPVEMASPFDDVSAKDTARYDQVDGPRLGFAEQTYCVRPLADASHRTLLMLRNKRSDLAAAVRYDVRELPYLSLWKHTAAPEDGYVVGIQPGTNYPYTRRYERDHGRVPSLSPGASHSMTLDFSLLMGTTEVNAAAAEIGRIQGDRKPLIADRPEP